MNKFLLTLSVFLTCFQSAKSQTKNDYYKLTEKYFHNSLYDSTIYYATLDLAINPTRTESLYMRGYTKKCINDFEGALRDFDHIILIDPQQYEAYNYRGEVKIDLKQFYDAIADYNKAIELEPNNSDFFARRAIALDSSSNKHGALQDLNRAIIMAPDSSSYYTQRARLYLKLRDTTLALKDYDSAFQITKSYSYFLTTSRYDRAQLKLERGDYKVAKEDCDFIIKNAKPIDSVYIRLAYMLRTEIAFKSGNYFAVLTDIEDRLKRETNNHSLFLIKAKAYAQLKEFEPALTAISKFISLEPNDAEGYTLRASIKFQGVAKEDHKQAELDINKAIEISPSFLTAYKLRCAMRGMSGNFAGALADAEILLKHNPLDALALSSKGMCLYFLNRKVEGCAILQKSAALGDQEGKRFLQEKCRGIMETKRPLHR